MAMNPIKNYTSEVPINRIFERLQKTLIEHGARQIVLDYGDGGKVHGLSFTIRVGEHLLHIKLPARIKQAQELLRQQYETGLISRKRGRDKTYGAEQAYRVAWRNILDWVEAQMALLDIGMVKLEEVFLPYVINANGKTLFEFFEANQFQLPEGQGSHVPGR